MRLTWDRLVGFGPSQKSRPKLKPKANRLPKNKNIDLPKLGNEVRGLFRRCPISEIFALNFTFRHEYALFLERGREVRSLQHVKVKFVAWVFCFGWPATSSSLSPESFVLMGKISPLASCQLLAWQLAETAAVRPNLVKCNINFISRANWIYK